MGKTVLGVFGNRGDAEDAINRLEDEGFNPKDISIVMRDSKQAEGLRDTTGADVATGAVSGATTGGVLGALAGLLVATGVVPGIGAILIGGPIAAALGLTGAAATTISGAVTGALAGGLIGVLTNLGLSKDEAVIYEDRIKEGGILLAVPTTKDREFDVRDLLEDYGADQVKSVDSSESVRERDRRREGIGEARPAYFSRISRKR